MPKRTDISSILVTCGSLAIAACGDAGSRNDNTSTSRLQGSTAECLTTFSKSAEAWDDGPVRATFVYDLTKADAAVVKRLWKKSPEQNGVHTGTVTSGGDAEKAVAEFLSRDPAGDTEMLTTDAVILVRVNDDPVQSFEDALNMGCERAGDGVAVRQVTFSRGKK